MSCYTILKFLLSLSILHLFPRYVQPKSSAATVDLAAFESNDTCRSHRERGSVALSQESVIQAIHDSVPEHIIKCGIGDWRSIAFLDMSDRSHRCSSPWREINANGIRACGRSYNSYTYGSCLSVLFSPPSPRQMYKNVCGRVIGYEYGSTDAFLNRWNNQNLNMPYVYGVSITHGTPRNHIWTLAVGLTEGAYFDKSVNCPCAHPIHRMNSAIPSLIGNNCYCESGNSGSWWQNDCLIQL